jgi:DtxR family Mn-dependent transcriptional regulator
LSHDADLVDQDVEELAEELWTLGEEGPSGLKELRQTSRVSTPEVVLEQCVGRGLARMEGEHIVLTPAGRALAEQQVRRHRLAEALFMTVLEVKDDEAVNRTACVIEHVLSTDLTDSICSFLGHPSLCPHGKPIPAGPCCRTLNGPLQPLVQPLSRLPLGQEGRIVYIAPREPARLVRLSNLGVVPGATVVLQQSSPAAVLRIGETTLALDPVIADEVYVKRTS